MKCELEMHWVMTSGHPIMHQSYQSSWLVNIMGRRADDKW